MSRTVGAALVALLRGLVVVVVLGGAAFAIAALGIAVAAAPLPRSLRPVQPALGAGVFVVGYGGLAVAMALGRLALGWRHRGALRALVGGSGDAISLSGFNLFGRGVSAVGALDGRPCSALAHGWDHLSVQLEATGVRPLYVGLGGAGRAIGGGWTVQPADSPLRPQDVAPLVADLGVVEQRLLVVAEERGQFLSQGGGWATFTPAAAAQRARGIAEALRAHDAGR
jgi:hypothetical protein